MDIRLRRLAADDQDFLWEALYHAVYRAPGADPLPRGIVQQPELSRYVSGWMRNPDDLGLLAEGEGKPIGAAWLRRWTGEQRGYGFMDAATPELSMAVLPGYRGLGIGTRLLRGMLAEAQLRFGSVSLSVEAANPARRLYAREGFATLGQSDDGTIRMVRDLRGKPPDA